MAERQAEIRQVETEITIRKLKRRAALEKVDDYITFAASKVAGLSLSLIGAVGIVLPDSTPLVIHDPAALLGIGVAMLVGKKAAQFIVKLSKVLEQK